MDVISVNVIKDLMEMELTATVCNCDIFYYGFINSTSKIQNIVFDDIFFSLQMLTSVTGRIVVMQILLVLIQLVLTHVVVMMDIFGMEQIVLVCN